MGRQGKMHSSPFQVENPRYKYAVEHQEMPSTIARGVDEPRLTCENCTCAYKVVLHEGGEKLEICSYHGPKGVHAENMIITHPTWSCKAAIAKEHQREQYYAARIDGLESYIGHVNYKMFLLEKNIQEELLLIECAGSLAVVNAHRKKVMKQEAEIVNLKRRSDYLYGQLGKCEDEYFECKNGDIGYNYRSIYGNIGNEKGKVKRKMTDEAQRIEVLKETRNTSNSPVTVEACAVAIEIRERHISRLRSRINRWNKERTKYKKLENLARGNAIPSASKQTAGLPEYFLEREKQIQEELMRIHRNRKYAKRRLKDIKRALDTPGISTSLIPWYKGKEEKEQNYLSTLTQKANRLEEELKELQGQREDYLQNHG